MFLINDFWNYKFNVTTGAPICSVSATSLRKSPWIVRQLQIVGGRRYSPLTLHHGPSLFPSLLGELLGGREEWWGGGLGHPPFIREHTIIVTAQLFICFFYRWRETEVTSQRLHKSLLNNAQLSESRRHHRRSVFLSKSGVNLSSVVDRPRVTLDSSVTLVPRQSILLESWSNKRLTPDFDQRLTI